ncbi:MAG: hypothetical protein M3N46_04560 [Actinomycetota bacterium]|nr:hypothetical protein [Actinomycetota bacterium]
MITTEAAAHAVLEYAAILGNHGRAATVVVPAVGPPESQIELLLGPASQLASVPVRTDEAPLDDTAFLTNIREQIADETHLSSWSGDDWSEL